MKYRLGILASHPIQYHAPVFRELARIVDLKVYYSHQQTPKGQADAGFNVPFEWDIDLLDGYDYEFLDNHSSNPCTSRFKGCDTPGIKIKIKDGRFSTFLEWGGI